MKASSTKSATIFDAELWVRENLRDAPSLKPETLQAVTGFTLLWNLFEGLVCNNRANVDTFQRITQNLASTAELEKLVDKSVSFYRSRYVAGQKMNARFNGLKFRKNGRRQHVESVLKGEVDDFVDKVFALLIIVYRIRNHIFHGLKSAKTWDDQAENISQASRVLSLIIEAKGGYIVEKRGRVRNIAPYKFL